MTVNTYMGNTKYCISECGDERDRVWLSVDRVS